MSNAPSNTPQSPSTSTVSSATISKPALSPYIIIACGCACAALTFGPRSSFGFYQLPVIAELGIGRDTFGLAVALQNLLWGVGQPFAGAVADRFGTIRVLWGGAILYALGLFIMSQTTSVTGLNIGAGVLIGFGLSGCSFNLVLAAFAKLLPQEWRGPAFGAGTAAGSFGQFLFSPLSVGLIEGFGWRATALIYAALMLLIIPLALALRTQANAGNLANDNVPERTLRQVLSEAFGHRSYILLVLGFFTCGFQLAFITAHLPAYFKDIGISPSVGGWTLAIIGLFNIIGSLSAGMLSNKMPRRYLLAIIYFARSVAILAFILAPANSLSAMLFGASMGLLWLSTVPPTSSLVSLMFGTRHMAMLYGFAFFSHQVGGFLGVLLGGILYESYGSYAPLWWGSIALGIASALINLPIVEKPVGNAKLAAAE